MVKIGAHLRKLSQKLNRGTVFLDHPVYTVWYADDGFGRTCATGEQSRVNYIINILSRKLQEAQLYCSASDMHFVVV